MFQNWVPGALQYQTAQQKLLVPLVKKTYAYAQVITGNKTAHA